MEVKNPLLQSTVTKGLYWVYSNEFNSYCFHLVIIELCSCSNIIYSFYFHVIRSHFIMEEIEKLKNVLTENNVTEIRKDTSKNIGR